MFIVFVVLWIVVVASLFVVTCNLIIVFHFLFSYVVMLISFVVCGDISSIIANVITVEVLMLKLLCW